MDDTDDEVIEIEEVMEIEIETLVEIEDHLEDDIDQMIEIKKDIKIKNN